ncbi:MAG: DsbA family protein [Alphaproteobacteria bacterium]|nr:DsbA family protein [Alphaproteobacteria bacterium]
MNVVLRSCLLAIAGLALAATLLTGTPGLAQSPAPAFTPAQADEIRELVRDYIRNNPEIIVEALQAFDAKQKAEQAAAQESAIRRRQNDLLRDPQSPSAGPAGADVTVVEFFDYRCPYCKQVVGALGQLKRGDPKLRVIYKELPILGPDSVIASRAALAAVYQGGYEKMHAALMARRGTLDEEAVQAVAQEVGLDPTRLKVDMARPEVAAQIERNRALARDLGIRGTPAFVIGERLVPGAIDLETMRGLVAQARQR